MATGALLPRKRDRIPARWRPAPWPPQADRGPSNQLICVAGLLTIALCTAAVLYALSLIEAYSPDFRQAVRSGTELLQPRFEVLQDETPDATPAAPPPPRQPPSTPRRIGRISPLWTAETRNFTAELQQHFARLPRLHELPPKSTVFLTFSNGHYQNLLLNAAALVTNLGYPIVVLAFDNATVQTCSDYQLPWLRSSRDMDTTDFRQNRLKFLVMGAEKPTAVLRLFDEFQASTVILVDTDTIWLRDPIPWLDKHPVADMFVTTDCLSHEAEVYNRTGPRCGHVPQSEGGGWALNTGVTVWRNTLGSRRFAELWGDLMRSHIAEDEPVDDQYTFNQLVTSELNPDGTYRAKGRPMRRHPDDDRVFFAAPDDAVKLMVLPSAYFAGGKTMFYNHLPFVYGTRPYVVHATFQRYNNNGKVARFREAGAFLLDPPEYYENGNFLVYDNLVLEFVEALEQLHSEPLNLLHKHVLASSYQVAAFRDAAAIARALNRTLVLPEIWAWCDSDNVPTVLATCSFEGSEQRAPWRAPVDLLVNMDILARTPAFLDWRVHQFLDHPSVPSTLRWSESSIWMHLPSQALPESYADGPHTHATTAPQLQQAVRGMDARVLRVQNLHPGSFLSFGSNQEDRQFNAWFADMMFDLKWCCGTQIVPLKQRGVDGLPLVWPKPLSAAQPPLFEVPAYTRPWYCNDSEIIQSLRQEHTRPLQYSMHPCNFLADASVLPSWSTELWEALASIRERNVWLQARVS